MWIEIERENGGVQYIDTRSIASIGVYHNGHVLELRNSSGSCILIIKASDAQTVDNYVKRLIQVLGGATKLEDVKFIPPIGDKVENQE